MHREALLLAAIILTTVAVYAYLTAPPSPAQRCQTATAQLRQVESQAVVEGRTGLGYQELIIPAEDAVLIACRR